VRNRIDPIISSHVILMCRTTDEHGVPNEPGWLSLQKDAKTVEAFLIPGVEAVDTHWPHKSGLSIRERFDKAQERKRQSLVEWLAATKAEQKRLESARSEVSTGSSAAVTVTGEGM
jgi:hypothetical protein